MEASCVRTSSSQLAECMLDMHPSNSYPHIFCRRYVKLPCYNSLPKAQAAKSSLHRVTIDSFPDSLDLFLCVSGCKKSRAHLACNEPTFSQEIWSYLRGKHTREMWVLGDRPSYASSSSISRSHRQNCLSFEYFKSFLRLMPEMQSMIVMSFTLSPSADITIPDITR